jgi:hypothetical protein
LLRNIGIRLEYSMSGRGREKVEGWLEEVKGRLEDLCQGMRASE